MKGEGQAWTHNFTAESQFVCKMVIFMPAAPTL